jgi:FlaA1/EpsC-like NDP-sugar epimerase
MFEKYPKWMNLLQNKAFEVFQEFSLPKWMVFALDNFAVIMIFFFAYLLRYNFASAEINFNLVFIHSLIVASVYIIFSLIFHSYSGIIRHTTLTDITTLFIETTSSLILLISLSVISRILGWGEKLTIPISVILIHYVTITVLLFFMRISVKVIFRFATGSRKSTKKVLIYGAGEMGFIVKRVLLSDPMGGFNVAGFIDENRKLQGKKINGLPVLNPAVITKTFIVKHKIETVIIAIKDITPSRKSEIINTAMGFGLEILETPSVDKWLNGQLQVRQLQKVEFEDLLGRDPIKLNLDLIGKGLKGKTILVTGAAGSIGSEIVRQLARFDTKKIILIDQAETPMFNIENELWKKFKNLKFQPILADITNTKKMELIFREYHPEIVFHAAAYKHVPLMEDNPHEALRVNVGGTKLITDLSVNFGVKKFVMISSDKSVNPVNVMGASKRICEMIVQSKAQQTGVKTQFVITRFGNVLGSNGSVIPIFRKQIKEGGPVTVTHPEITRYFMTIPEACELVLEAGFMGNGGEIFVFDMGEPVKIINLAYQMIRLSGLVPLKDIKIEYIGLRPGEKLYEEVLSDKENTIPTHHPKIKIAKVEKLNDLDLLSKIDGVLNNIYSLSKKEIVKLIGELVPEYKCGNGK